MKVFVGLPCNGGGSELSSCEGGKSEQDPLWWYISYIYQSNLQKFLTNLHLFFIK